MLIYPLPSQVLYGLGSFWAIITEHHSLGTSKQQTSISQSGGWKSKVKAWTDSMSCEILLPALQRCLLTVTSHGGRCEGALGSFVRVLIASQGLHPHDLLTSPDPYHVAPSHWALGFNHKFWGNTGILTITSLPREAFLT